MQDSEAHVLCRCSWRHPRNRSLAQPPRGRGFAQWLACRRPRDPPAALGSGDYKEFTENRRSISSVLLPLEEIVINYVREFWDDAFQGLGKSRELQVHFAIPCCMIGADTFQREPSTWEE